MAVSHENCRDGLSAQRGDESSDMIVDLWAWIDNRNLAGAGNISTGSHKCHWAGVGSNHPADEGRKLHELGRTAFERAIEGNFAELRCRGHWNSRTACK